MNATRPTRWLKFYEKEGWQGFVWLFLIVAAVCVLGYLLDKHTGKKSK